MFRLIRQKTLDELINKASSKALGLGYLLGQTEANNRHYSRMFGEPDSLALKQAQILLDQKEAKEGEL